MITKLTLKNFKSFRNAEIRLGSLSLIVGANATGKSNVRDALRFLHGIARGYNLAEILGEKYGEGGQLQWAGIRGGTREVCHAGGPVFGVAVEILPDQRGSQFYRYEIDVRCGVNGTPPRVVRECLYDFNGMVFDSHPRADAPKQNDTTHLAVKLESGGKWRKTGPTLTGIANQPILAQAMELAEQKDAQGKIRTGVAATISALDSIRFIDFSPEAMRKPSVPGQLILSDRGDNLSSVLQAICEKPELKQALSDWIQELTPMDVSDFDFVEDASGKILVRLVEEGGAGVSANSASDGTLRFLGVLAALLGPKPARFHFLEEIDNGIHPARLSLLMDLLSSQSRRKGVQVVATTHSPQVLRLMKGEDLKYATLAYRVRGRREACLKPLMDIPHFADVREKQDLAHLHESAWLEQAMQFSEGVPEEVLLETEGLE